MGSKEGRVPGKDVPEVQKPLLDEGEAEAEGGKEGGGSMKKNKRFKYGISPASRHKLAMELDRITRLKDNAKHDEERRYLKGKADGIKEVLDYEGN
jgi:hypothetical protein